MNQGSGAGKRPVDPALRDGGLTRRVQQTETFNQTTSILTALGHRKGHSRNVIAQIEAFCAGVAFKSVNYFRSVGISRKSDSAGSLVTLAQPIRPTSGMKYDTDTQHSVWYR